MAPAADSRGGLTCVAARRNPGGGVEFGDPEDDEERFSGERGVDPDPESDPECALRGGDSGGEAREEAGEAISRGEKGRSGKDTEGGIGGWSDAILFLRPLKKNETFLKARQCCHRVSFNFRKKPCYNSQIEFFSYQFFTN